MRKLWFRIKCFFRVCPGKEVVNDEGFGIECARCGRLFGFVKWAHSDGDEIHDAGVL